MSGCGRSRSHPCTRRPTPRTHATSKCTDGTNGSRRGGLRQREARHGGSGRMPSGPRRCPRRRDDPSCRPRHPDSRSPRQSEGGRGQEAPCVFFLNRRFATLLDGLTIFQDDSLLFPPGTRFSYSSYAWNLVSAVVEGASGDNFLHYMSAHVFRPLGLTHTAPDRADSLILGRTQFYDRDSAGRYHIAPSVDNSYKWAGGGFVSTAEDLVKFGSALLEPGLLQPETLDLLFTSQRTSAGEQTGYGIGWFLRTDSLGHRWAFHGGGSVGGTTVFGLDRDSRVVVAILTNLSDAPLDPAQEIEAAFDR